MGIPKYLENKIKSIVHCCGVADVPSASKPTVKTNQQLDGKPVYQSFYTFSLTATSPYIITSTVNTLIGAQLIATVAGKQYSLNGGATAIANCDASLAVAPSGNIEIDWTTTHAIGDTLEVYITYTLQ